MRSLVLPRLLAGAQIGLVVPATSSAAMPPSADEKRSWVDAIAYEGFVDAYASLNYRFPKPQSPVVPFGFVGGNQLRCFDMTDGFALNWVGIGASHPPDPVGGGVSLRFGPGIVIFNAPPSPDSSPATGLQYVKNAYVAWRPAGQDGKVTLTFGKLSEPFGSEVADSQGNINYTRSLLFTYAQPFFFTGFRLDVEATSALSASFFLVDGWNTSQDTNLAKTAALQINWKPEEFGVGLGYSIGAEQPDVAYGPLRAVDGADSRYRHLIDLIVEYRPIAPLRLLFNADYGQEKLPPGAPSGTARWYGMNLAARYQLDEVWAVGLRGEFYADPQGFTTRTNTETRVGDVTLTGAFTPSPHLIVKIDNRVDVANEPFFQKGVTDRSSTQFTTTLGVVATTGP
jgi:hypothetical protein